MDNSGTGARMPFTVSGNTMSVGLNTPVIAKREVDAAIDDVANEIEYLAKTVQELYERLAPAMLPSVPQASKDGVEPAKYVSVLASSLDSKANYIRTNREQLQDILSRLQI